VVVVVVVVVEVVVLVVVVVGHTNSAFLAQLYPKKPMPMIRITINPAIK
jgi:hypothetical protein